MQGTFWFSFANKTSKPPLILLLHMENVPIWIYFVVTYCTDLSCGLLRTHSSGHRCWKVVKPLLGVYRILGRGEYKNPSWQDRSPAVWRLRNMHGQCHILEADCYPDTPGTAQTQPNSPLQPLRYFIPSPFLVRLNRTQTALLQPDWSLRHWYCVMIQN